jgi:uncharacterized protein
MRWLDLLFLVTLKPRGALCNLDCAYCYYLEKEELYPGSSFRMDDEVLEAFTRQYIESQQGPEVVFAWQGGEPTLMGLDFFRRAIELQRRYARPGVRVSNRLQTNGTTLDDAWCRFFARNGFLLGLSLDGPADLHDAYRVDKGGKPTFDSVMSGLELIRKHGVEFNVLTTVHAANAHHPLEVYRFLRDEAAAHFIQFIPIVERAPDGGASERSVPAEAYGDFLCAVFDEWIRGDVGRVFVQIFDVALAAWATCNPGLCIFQKTCGRALAMEHNGDVYSCDHFVTPAHRVGNVLETPLPVLVGGDKQRAFGTAKRTSRPSYCRTCEVHFACNGGCPKNRFARTPDGEPGLNYLCPGYKRFFTHVGPAMEWVTEALRRRQPPAGIMNELPERYRRPG